MIFIEGVGNLGEGDSGDYYMIQLTHYSNRSGNHFCGGEGADTLISNGEGQISGGGAGNDIIVALSSGSGLSGGDLLVVGGLGAATFANADLSDFTSDVDLVAFMRMTEDSSTAVLEIHSQDDATGNIAFVGSIDFDLVNGKMIDTLKIGDLEVGMVVMLEAARTVGNDHTANWGDSL